MDYIPSDEEITIISLQGGNCHISSTAIALSRTAIFKFLHELVRECLVYMEHFRRITISLDDVLLSESSLKRKNGHSLCGMAGFDDNEHG